jgi:ribosomal protein L7/L12
MTIPLAVFDAQFLVVFLVAAAVLAVVAAAQSAAGLKPRVTALESQVAELRRRLDELSRGLGIESPDRAASDLSAEVRRLASTPAGKIAAIKLYREEHPGVGLAEAKARIDAFCEGRG